MEATNSRKENEKVIDLVTMAVNASASLCAPEGA